MTQKQSKRKKLLPIAGGILLANILVSFFLTKGIYDAAFPRYDYTPETLPACYEALAPIMKETSFPSGDNTLRGKLFDGTGDSLVVMVQGINSYSEAYYPIIEAMVAQRDVFIFDTTGSCTSEGKSAIGFSQTVYDLNAALDHISKTYDYEDIFLFGHSRGGYAACCVLEQRQDVDGVVAICSPNSAMEAVVGPVADRIGFLAYGNYPMLWLYQVMLFDTQTVSLSAADAIGKSDVPVLIVHADNDRTVPAARYSIYAHKDEIEDADFLLLSGDHTSVLFEQALWTATDTFFDALDGA